MQIKFEVRWLAGGRSPLEVDLDLFRLLAAVDDSGSLAHATRDLGLSYRHAWGLIRKWENRFHAPLLETRRGRGRGARLTEFARTLVAERGRIESEVSGMLRECASRINSTLQRFGSGRQTVVRIAASHGMAIGKLMNILREKQGLDVHMLVRGSLESLRMLNRGECAVAGFHMPMEPLRSRLAPLFSKWLRDNRFTLLMVAERQQGLMTAKSNPKRIHGVRDLVRRSVRFVNRQPDSGTRIIMDALLQEDRIVPEQIRGYSHEEFTHVAVAAMIASRAADAGFGIEAAAAEFELRFIPLIKEAYFLALPVEATAMKQVLQSALRSASFRRQLHGLAGYDGKQAGEEFQTSSLFAGAPG